MRKILIVVDMQKDFIDGSLGTSEAEAVVDRVIAKIKAYPAEDVYATRKIILRPRRAGICRCPTVSPAPRAGSCIRRSKGLFRRIM